MAGTGSAAAETKTVGWQVATFALERLRPDAGCDSGSSAIWEAYRAWCERRGAVPLAFAVFHAEFQNVAEAAGLQRRQVGAHVHYLQVRLESEAL